MFKCVSVCLSVRACVYLSASSLVMKFATSLLLLAAAFEIFACLLILQLEEKMNPFKTPK